MKKHLLSWLLILPLLFLSGNLSAQTTLQFDQATGLFKIRYQTVPVVQANFVFWYDKWKWSRVRVKGQVTDNGRYVFSGRSKKTGLSLKGVAKSRSPTEMTWRLDVNESENWQRKQRGGFEFNIDTSALKQNDFAPEASLLPDKKGWQLKLRPNQSPMRVLFDPAPAQIYFDRGRKNQIRVYFVPEKTQKKAYSFQMTIALPPDGRVVKTVTERLAKPSPKTWYRNLIAWNQSPVDLSFLNAGERPAGKRGFLRAQGEDLVFEDGTKARFWGTNITANALFKTSEPDMRAQAKRISRLGFNLVRLHHHDSKWVRPNIFGNRADNTLSLDPQSVERIDLWIKALRDEGIYVWLDLLVGREFTAKDGIRGFTEIAKGKKTTAAKGFTYINPDIQDRIKEFNKAYLNHVNPYTSLAYKDDPAIIGMLITNENDLANHYGNALLPNKKVPEHNKIYMSLARKFAAEKGLDYNKTWRSWEHGPSKLFLNDLEHQFNRKMISDLRRLGVKVSIATTNTWGGMPLSGLPSLSDGDVITVNSYGSPDLLSFNPRYRANLAHWIAAAGISGKPVVTTEWNLTPFPAFDRSTAPTYLASLASLQGWNAMMQYAYAQVPIDGPSRPSNWHSYNDPALLAMLPVAALLYRQGHVQAARRSYYLSLPPKVLMGEKISPATSRSIRTLAEQSKLRIALPAIPELPWLKPEPAPPNAIIVRDPNRDFIPEGQDFVCSDTQEICRNWVQGVATINTPKSQIASGWIGGRSIALDNLSLQIKTANASVAVQSLDGTAISQSTRILISMAAQSVPEKRRKLPFLSEPIEGVLQIRAREGLSLFALNAVGNKKALEVNRINGKYIIPLDKKMRTYWLMLAAPD
jgi:hypothetical protein